MKIAQLFKEFINIINKSFNKLVNLLITTLSKPLSTNRDQVDIYYFAGWVAGLSATEFYYRMIAFMGLKVMLLHSHFNENIGIPTISFGYVYCYVNSGNTSELIYFSGSRQISWYVCHCHHKF